MGTAPTDVTGLSTRQRILREASLLFATKGYHGTSTREIAAAVGIQQPSLFHHFESKDTIMAELIAFDLDEPVAVAERCKAAADGSPAVRLYRYLVWDIAFLCSSPYNLSSIEAVRTNPGLCLSRAPLPPHRRGPRVHDRGRLSLPGSSSRSTQRSPSRRFSG